MATAPVWLPRRATAATKCSVCHRPVAANSPVLWNPILHQAIGRCCNPTDAA